MDIETNTDTPSVSPETESSAISTPAIDGNVPAAPVVEEQFTPNYKYKAYGKEFEVDEWARPLLTKDTQPHLIKLFEKAGGFEPLKESYKTLEQEFGTYKSAYTELDQVRNQLVTSIEKGDLGSAFKLLGVNSQQIREFVKKELEYEGMSPQQRAEIDRQRQLEQSQFLYQQQIQEQQRFAQDLIMQKHELEVMTTFNSPKYAPLIESYNQRAGSDAAFRDVVDRIGNYEFSVNGRNIPVSEAVEQAIRMLGLSNQASPEMPQEQQQVFNNNPAAPQKPKPKPIVVPNGSTTAPVKKAVSTWEDLKRAQQEAFAN